MRQLYSVAPLSDDEVAPAFAIVLALYPGIDLDTWSAFARTLIHANATEARAIVGMRTGDGYLCGLFAYRVDTDFEYRSALVVDPIAVLDLIEPKPAMRAMIDAIESTAKRLGCGRTCIHVRGTHASLGSRLARLGYAPEAQILSKVFAMPGPI